MNLTKKPKNGRGCGERYNNVPYLCTGTSENGLPIENFIIDPAIRYFKEFTRGYALIQDHNYIYHVIIFIGKSYYASPWDFVEEARRFGISRRIPNNFPFHKLTIGRSKFYFAHSRIFPLTQINFRITYSICKNEQLVPGLHKPLLKNKVLAVTNCTFNLRDLAVFHSPYVLKDNVYTVNQKSFSYITTPPNNVTIDGKVVKANINSKENKPLHNDLNKIPIEYSENYGLFLSTYITHVEAKNNLPEETKKKINKAGINYKVLDY